MITLQQQYKDLEEKFDRFKYLETVVSDNGVIEKEYHIRKDIVVDENGKRYLYTLKQVRLIVYMSNCDQEMSIQQRWKPERIIYKVSISCGHFIDSLFIWILFNSPIGSGPNLRSIYKKPSRKLGPEDRT